jgi:hypothetical protein
MKVVDVFWNLPDDTIRLWLDGKPDDALIQRLRKTGYRYWPGRQLNVASWCTAAEDLALELSGNKKLEMREEEDNSDARVDRFVLLAQKAGKRAQAEQEKVHAIADMIPFGQPILVGHHSERRARRDAERIDNGMRRSVEETKKAQYWEERADGAARRAAQREDPGVIARRIEKLEAENRKRNLHRIMHMEMVREYLRDDLGYGKTEEVKLDHLNNAFQDALQGNYALRTPKPASGRALEGWETMAKAIRNAGAMEKWYERWISHNATVLEYQRRQYQESGGIPVTRDQIKVGSFVFRHRHWCKVLKVNRKTVYLDYSWLAMPPAPLEISRITEIRTAEEHAAALKASRQ